MTTISIPYYRDPIFIDTGYEELTTFFNDFTIADRFGVKAIKETYRDSLAYAKSDYKVLTELVMVLNHKIGQYYDYTKPSTNQDPRSILYNDLYWELAEYAESHLQGEELDYYYRTTD